MGAARAWGRGRASSPGAKAPACPGGTSSTTPAKSNPTPLPSRMRFPSAASGPGSLSPTRPLASTGFTPAQITLQITESFALPSTGRGRFATAIPVVELQNQLCLGRHELRSGSSTALPGAPLPGAVLQCAHSDALDKPGYSCLPDRRGCTRSPAAAWPWPGSRRSTAL